MAVAFLLGMGWLDSLKQREVYWQDATRRDWQDPVMKPLWGRKKDPAPGSRHGPQQQDWDALAPLTVFFSSTNSCIWT